MQKQLLPIIALLALSLHSFSQQYSFIQYTVEDGLAQSQVRDLYQDTRGYIWVATLGGLSRFDGRNFINYSKENGMLDNQVNCIVEDDDANLWLGTIHGISKFDRSTFTNYEFPEKYTNAKVLDLKRDSKGGFWAATNGSGVIYMDESGNFTAFNTDHGLPDNYVRAIHIDEQERVWIGTKGGLCFMQEGKLNQVAPMGFDKVSYSKILEDKYKNLWITTFKNGVFKYDGNKFTNYMPKDGLISSNIRNVLVDHRGNVWFAAKKGLSKFDGETFTNLKENDGLPTPNMKSLIEDNERNIWLGTDGGGMLKFTGEQFVNFTIEDGLCGDIVMNVLQDDESNMWFSTYSDGICKFDGETYENFRNVRESSMKNETVWSGTKTQKGDLWFGTSGGVLIYSNSSMRVFEFEDDMRSKRITALMEDQSGKMWFGHREGVSVFDGQKVTNFGKDEGLTDSPVRGLHQSPDGTIWIGSEKGLFTYSGKKFKKYDVDSGLSDNIVFSITSDHRQNTWIGTSNRLNLWNGKEFESFKLGDNLGSNYINFVTIDQSNQMWVGTNYYVYRVDLNQFYNEQRFEAVAFTNMDGIISTETNMNSGYVDNDGNVWFGTASGLIKFDPRNERDRSIKHTPYVHIADLRLLLQKKDWSDHCDSIDVSTKMPINLRVQPDQNHLTFDYVGISHTYPKEVVFKYMLEGEDEDWLPATNATFATYNNLSPGEYTFHVLAGNRNNVWASKPDSFKFTVLPPYYLTGWFFALVFFTTSGLVYAIYRWRARIAAQKEATKQLVFKSRMLDLEQQTLNSSMNRHFVFNALNSIQYYINDNDKRAANKYLTSFAKLIRKNLDSSQSSQSTLADELERLRLYLELEHMRFHNKFTYDIAVDPGVDCEAVKIPPMLLQPYVENSIWHGILPSEKKGTVQVSIQQNNNSEVEIVIEDNGIGIDESLERKNQSEHSHVSKGMKITHGRINLLRKMTNKNMYIDGPNDIRNGEDESGGTRVRIVMGRNEVAVNA